MAKDPTASVGSSRADGAQEKVLPKLSVEVHDTWLQLMMTKRAVVAVDIPHGIMSLSQQLQPYHPIQMSGSTGVGVCAMEVLNFAVHRMRDESWCADILKGSIAKASYQADCDTYPQRLSEGVPSDRFFNVEVFRAATPLAALQYMRGNNLADEHEPSPYRAHVEVVGFHVDIPMPANISLHGRREGLRGAWSSQNRFVNDSIAHWTDLGVMAGDCLLVQKALQVLVTNRMSSSSTSQPTGARGAAKTPESSSVTELPQGLPQVDLHLTNFDVKIMDDSFEVWMGAFQRLHLDEAAERLKRAALLTEKIHLLRRSGEIKVSPQAESRMWADLECLHSKMWVGRVAKLKRSHFFQSPPPLMSFHVDTLTGLFIPRQAPWLEDKVADLDLSGLTRGSPLWPEFDLLVGGQMSNVKAGNVRMRLRDYIAPLFEIAAVHVCSGTPTDASRHLYTNESMSCH